MSEQKRNEILDGLNSVEPEELYRQNYVNWSGPRSSSEDPYSEVIAKHLLENSVFKGKFEKSDRDSYLVEGHHGVTKQVTNRSEEIFAKSLLGHHLEYLGGIIDYQVPLKSKQSDKYGKIDLISISEGSAHLIELKMGNKETLLRAVLEIETYSRILNPKLFKEYLKEKIKQRYCINGKSNDDNLPEEIEKWVNYNILPRKIKKAVLIAVDDENDLPKALNSKPGKYKNLRKLLVEYSIEVYTIDRVYPVKPVQL